MNQQTTEYFLKSQDGFAALVTVVDGCIVRACGYMADGGPHIWTAGEGVIW